MGVCRHRQQTRKGKTGKAHSGTPTQTHTHTITHTHRHGEKDSAPCNRHHRHDRAYASTRSRRHGHKTKTKNVEQRTKKRNMSHTPPSHTQARPSPHHSPYHLPLLTPRLPPHLIHQCRVSQTHSTRSREEYKTGAIEDDTNASQPPSLELRYSLLLHARACFCFLVRYNIPLIPTYAHAHTMPPPVFLCAFRSLCASSFIFGSSSRQKTEKGTRDARLDNAHAWEEREVGRRSEQEWEEELDEDLSAGARKKGRFVAPDSILCLHGCKWVCECCAGFALPTPSKEHTPPHTHIRTDPHAQVR